MIPRPFLKMISNFLVRDTGTDTFTGIGTGRVTVIISVTVMSTPISG